MTRRLLELLKLKQPRQPILQQCSVSDSCYDTFEQVIIEKVIELIKANPDNFSARWFGDKMSLCRSVESKCRNYLIMIDTGQIIEPVDPKMSKQQMEELKQLLQPIVKKDSDYLIEKLL